MRRPDGTRYGERPTYYFDPKEFRQVVMGPAGERHGSTGCTTSGGVRSINYIYKDKENTCGEAKDPAGKAR